MRPRSLTALPYIAAVLVAGFAVPLLAQSFNTFTLQETPNPTAVGQYTTLTASITGTSGTPPGQVEFYISNNTDGCSPDNYAYLIGQTQVYSPGTATVTWTPTEYGNAPICATYIPSGDGDPYAPATVGPTQFTINQGFNSFDIGATPSPVGDGNTTTLTAILSGSSQYGVPTGTVQFYISSNPTTCNNSGNTISGQLSISGLTGADGSATYNWSPNSPGTFAICAAYTPNGDGDNYSLATAGPYSLTVNQPSVLWVSVPAEPALETPLPFTFYLPTPGGQTAPSGTITLYDPNCNSEYETCTPNFGLSLGSISVTGGGVYGPLYAALSGLDYAAFYSGDANYEPQYYYGTLQLENGLNSISPAAVTPATSATTTYTLTGTAINSDSNQLVELVVGGEHNRITPTSFNCSGSCPIPQLQFTIPSTLSVGEVSVYLVIPADTDLGYATLGGPVTLQVYNQYPDTVTDSAAPGVAYGSANFSATVTRGAPGTDAAVPAGTVTFSLNGTGDNPYSATVGSATLSQVPPSSSSYYLNPFTEPMDTNGSAKLVAADLNGDGYVDVVGLPGPFYADGAYGPYLQVMLSTGDNAFQTEQQVFTGCEAQDFAVGDIHDQNGSGNGIPDLVVICYNNSDTYNATSPLQAYYMLGNGDGTFQQPVAFGGNANFISPTNVVLGQFNNDGYLDIAVIDGDDGVLQVISPFGNSGNPTYGPQINFDTSNGDVVNAGAADFNQDGWSDLAIEEYDYNEDEFGNHGALLVLLNGQNGYFNQSETSFAASTSNMQGMTIADVNGDGYPDIALADPGGFDDDTGNILIFENTQNAQNQWGNFSTPYFYQTPGGGEDNGGAGAVAGVPFPTIGQPAAGAPVSPGWNLVYTYVGNNGDLWVAEIQRNNATSWSPFAPPFDTNSSPFGDESGPYPDFIVTGDMNGDGYLDFALNGGVYPPESDQEQYVLQPWYYSNDAQATLTGSLPSPLPPGGIYNLTASYPGSQLYQPNSNSVQITINPVTTSGKLTGPTSAVAYGTNVTLTATVNGISGGAAPTGTVTFYNGGISFQSQTLTPGAGSTATASIQTNELPDGLNNITVSYGGDGNYNQLISFGTLNVQVNATPVSLVLTESTDSTTAGTVVTFQVQASGAILPFGQTVTLTGIPTAAAVTPIFNIDGLASYSYGLFPPGTYTIQASLAGSSSFVMATSNTVSLHVGLTPVNVTLTSSANPVAYPTAINLTANATSDGLGVPTGSISFENGGSQIGSGALVSDNGSSGLLSVGNIDVVTGQTVIAVATGDFNGDHNQDLAVLESGSGSASLLISLGNGDGTFQAPTIYSSTEIAGFDPSSVAIAAADFNGDGYTDLVVAASDGAIAVILAAGDAAGDLNILQAQLIPTPYAPLAVATGDFNKDGNQDFVVIGTNNVTAFYGTGSTPSNFPTGGSWTNPNPSNSSHFTGITVADFNHDGYADFAISDNSVPDVAVFFYNSDGGGFSGPNTYPVGASATAIASGDVNGDGYPDLAVVSSIDSTVDVLINLAATNGNASKGTFGSATSYGVASQPNAVAMNDLNKDGYADVAVTGSGTGEGGGTTILLGSQNGAMWGETSLPAAYGQAIASADFNNDGNPDLAVGLNGVTVFLDQSAQATLRGAVLPAGTDPVTGVYTPTSPFAGSTSNTVSEVVSETASTISWSNPSAIPYGTLLSVTQLNAAASVPGTYVYTPAAGTLLSAGSHQLSVTFTPNDPSYLGLTATVSITVNQVASTIAWTGPSAITYGTALSGTQLNASASVAGTLTYTPAAGTVLTAGPHTLFVTFTPTDTLDYLGATASVSISVSQGAPAISWPTPAAITYGTALSNAQLNATTPVAGTYQYTPPAGTVLNAGTRSLTVDFTPNDQLDYVSASATVSLTVNKVATTVGWSSPAAIPYGTALSSTQLNATASVPGTFAYSPALGTVLPAGSHTLSVTFTPSDSVDYQVSTSSVSITVSQGAPAITWSNPAAILYGAALSNTQLNATASVPGTFLYSPAGGAVLAAGAHTLAVTFTPTDATDYSTATANVSITVNQATPTITWTTPVAIPYGTALSATQLNASASTAGTLTYTPASGTVLTAGSHTLNVSFAPTDTTDYATATGSVSIQVNQATPVITWATPAAITYGTPLSSTQLNATATPPGGAFTYTPPAGTTLPVGTQTLNVKYVPTDTTDYATASSTVTIQVNPGLVLSTIEPTSGGFGSAATAITLTGTGFASNTIVQLNGTAITSSFLSPTSMTAVIPASFFAQTQAGAITVTNPTAGTTTPSIQFTVTLPNVQVTFSGPDSASPGQQPTLNLEFLQGYPLPVDVTLTLTVQPPATGGPVDPAVQFSTGGTTQTFALPANSVTIPAIQLQTGTLAATITVTLTLESGGLDVTPTGLQPVVMVVPAVAPVIASGTLTAGSDTDPDTLTVTIQGYSSTREVSSAIFTFTPAAGATIDGSPVTVDVSTDFSSWFSQESSDQYGGAFTFTQTFNLSSDASTVASVSVTLTNSVGTSNSVTAK